ncbi:MAG: periplasmic heavy metal sensor [Pseudomonadota bacterium]
MRIWDALTRTPWWLRITLVVSLSLNMGLLGLEIGERLRAAEGETRQSGRFVERMVGFLPEDSRPRAREILTVHDPANEQALTAMRAATEQLIAALRADPFDPGAMDAAMRARTEALALRFSHRQHRFMMLGEALQPDERRAFADGLEAWMRRRTARRGEQQASGR